VDRLHFFAVLTTHFFEKVPFYRPTEPGPYPVEVFPVCHPLLNVSFPKPISDFN